MSGADAELAFKQQIVKWLERLDISEAELARRITDDGVPMRQQSVWQMLHKGRTVSLNEAMAISRVVGIPLISLTYPAADAPELAAQMTAWAERAHSMGQETHMLAARMKER